METRSRLFEELNRETQYYSEHTRSQYRSHLIDYLDFIGDRDWRDRDLLYDYVEKRLKKKRGLSQRTVNYIVRGPIGALFRAHGLRLPIKLPRVKVALFDFSERLSFTREEIIKFIQVARKSGNKQWQNIMALATTYGIRASEIRLITREHVHPKKKTFIIYLKGGLKREFTVPPQIEPCIFGYDYPVISQNELYNIFTQIAKAAGIERVHRKTFHAIRHGLITELRYGSKIPQPTISTFMGWRESGMVGIYASPYLPDIDQEVFQKHPFLKFWQ